jgi:riboflavin synthase alpha subunit
MENTNNNTGWWIGGIIVVLLLIIGGIYLFRSGDSSYQGENQNASSTDSQSSIILPYGLATVALGDTISFRGISITPTSIVEDSRCAKGVQCIQAGTVRVNVRAKLDSGTTSNLAVALSKAAAIGTYSVTLVSVSPEKTQSAINSSDYRFVFEVRQSATNPTGDEGLMGKG